MRQRTGRRQPKTTHLRCLSRSRLGDRDLSQTFGSHPRHKSYAMRNSTPRSHTHRRRSRDRLRESRLRLRLRLRLRRLRCLRCDLCDLRSLSLSLSFSSLSPRRGLREAGREEASQARRCAWRRSCSSLDRMMGRPLASAPLGRRSLDMRSARRSKACLRHLRRHLACPR